MSTPRPLNFLITGGARGIGRGLGRLLLESGHRVILLDSNTEELTHTTLVLQNQFQKPKSKIDMIASIIFVDENFKGHLDVLVNNAAYTGGVGGVNIENLTLEEWNASIETNLTAPMLMSQACLPLLRKSSKRPEGGAIINMSSTRAHQSEANSEGYATTKAGLIGLTHSLAVSLAPMGITVNAMLPGWIHALNECKEADEKGQKWEEGLGDVDHGWHLSGRVGKVEDVARVVEYLAGARFVTGTEQVIDGGVTRRMVYPE